MLDPRTRYSLLAAAAVLALAWAGGPAHRSVQAGEPQGVVNLLVVMVEASGSGGKARFDERIPGDLRQQLARLHLSYSRYAFLGAPRQRTPLGETASFPLPDRELLTVRPSAHSPQARVLRLDTRIFDARRRPILNSQVRVGYGRSFLLHRPKGPTGLLLGISAHRGGR